METIQCPRCGSHMSQTGADSTSIQYRCVACGYAEAIPLTEGGNVVYIQKRSDLISRIHLGSVDWRVTSWERLYQELITFIGCYEEAQTDIQLQMGIVACITCGFNVMDAEKYQQCKILYKLTEKLYKQHLKVLKAQSDVKLYESVADYKESRAKYKKCRNEYRNTKIIWKGVFFVFRKLAFK